jgi:hypothetical protein
MCLRENNCNDFINHAQEAWDQIYGRSVSVMLVALSYEELIRGVCVWCARVCVWECVSVCDSASLVEQTKKDTTECHVRRKFRVKILARVP